VAAVTAPPGRSLLGRIAAAASARARAKGRQSRLAAFIGENVLTVAALSAGVADGFIHGTGWGLGSLMAALLIIDFKLQG
jgi:hypothetical protein